MTMKRILGSRLAAGAVIAANGTFCNAIRKSWDSDIYASDNEHLRCDEYTCDELVAEFTSRAGSPCGGVSDLVSKLHEDNCIASHNSRVEGDDVTGYSIVCPAILSSGNSDILRAFLKKRFETALNTSHKSAREVFLSTDSEGVLSVAYLTFVAIESVNMWSVTLVSPNHGFTTSSAEKSLENAVNVARFALTSALL